MATKLETNTVSLRELLDIANALPEAGGELQEKTVDPSLEVQEITADAEYDGLSKVTVNAIESNGEISGTIDGLDTRSFSIPEGYTTGGTVELDGTIDGIVTDQADLMAQIQSALEGRAGASADPVLQEKTVTPTAEAQTIVADSGYDGLMQVVVDGDVDLIPENIKSGVTVFGVEGTCEARNTGIPSFEYTGSHTPLDDGDGNWKIKFLSTGTLTLEDDCTVDIFAVGGGGNGSNRYTEDTAGGGGGGGGYTTTVKNLMLQAGTYVINIGASAGMTSIVDESGNTFCSAAAGKTGTPTKNNYLGGDGGSGGGGAGVLTSAGGGGGSDGSDGLVDSHPYSYAGEGQGTTTREFGEETGDLYAGGGGGGAGTDGLTGGVGGDGGGGAGATASKAATPGEDNTGGGGGGGSAITNQHGAAGGTGIVIIRNARA